MLIVGSCQKKQDEIGKIGPGPTNPKITVISTDPYNPVFTASADNGFIYHWDMGNAQIITPGKNSATSYYPFVGTYNVECTIYGEGGASTNITTVFKVSQTDPSVATKPVWKELTNSGSGKIWVYNTNPTIGSPDYCFQTTGDLATYPDNWMPSSSWGQCVRITPDVKGSMVFDLNGGINFTYHHVEGDAGVKGTFILNADKMTLKISDPFILDHAINCSSSTATATGEYDIKLLTDTSMVLWQNQKNGTGWSWSFKRK